MGATDSKLAFRKSVFRLFEEKNIAWDADDFWSLFWTLPESVNDVFSLVGASDIRRARDTTRENIETLVDKILQQMDKLIHEPSFPSPHYSTLHLLNCCRVLTRIIPFLYEQNDDEWERTFFWTRRSVTKNSSATTANNDHQQQANGEDATLPSRGELLLSLTLRSLFLAGFTLPPTLKSDDNNNSNTNTNNQPQQHVNYVIWETGIGCSTPIGSLRDNESHRVEVLRLLLVLLSQSMYVPATQYLRKGGLGGRWLHSLVSGTREKRIILALLCSLINTASNYNPSAWGRAAPSVVVFNDTREQLVVLCLRVLLLLLDTHSPASMLHLLEQQQQQQQQEKDLDHNGDNDDYATVEKEWISAAEGNKFMYFLSKIHRAQDFQFLIDGFYRTLSHPMQGLVTYLPASSKRSKCYFEMTMLCWKLTQINPRFRAYLMETERALDLTLVLIYHAMENKLDPSQLGFVRMCVFVLQTLSTDRRFGTKLNKPFQGHASLPSSIRPPPSDPAFAGSYADFLILSIFNLIATSRGHLSILYPSLIITLTNISPYLKYISAPAAGKWIALFGSFSAPGFLLADQNNPALVQYLLEAFQNVIRYQSSENGALICSIVRNHIKFERLSELDLDQALSDMTRKRQQQQQQQQRPLNLRSASSASSSPTVATFTIHDDDDITTSDDATVSEKALGKRPEESAAASSSSSTSVAAARRMPQRQASSSSTLSLPSSPAATGFNPDNEWLESWRLQWTHALDYILAVTDRVLPVIQKVGERQALDTIRTMDLQPPSLASASANGNHGLRAVPWSEPIIVGVSSALWAHIYLQTPQAISPWHATHIRLFHIKPSASNSTTATVAATTSSPTPPAPPFSNSAPPTPTH
ncbi:high-temperature-induced dauer-formation protein-domain-containing protein [Absidia repens]|uniref:High-temperature-induced dauer-formation protein-domain-containing protein n=1 Tax=Absidia repens TaxID=90262 RepID=A0A1X2I7L8_9FUNG|nr:high-temperature-induced dauer-formation protein-domain-containing protein [Absidia repens]